MVCSNAIGRIIISDHNMDHNSDHCPRGTVHAGELLPASARVGAFTRAVCFPRVSLFPKRPALCITFFSLCICICSCTPAVIHKDLSTK